MIREDSESPALQEVVEVLDGSLDAQKFLVKGRVVPLRRVQLAREKS